MANAADDITVYRSADMNGEEDARAVWNFLIENGLAAELLSDKYPGVVEGSWEVRVPANEAEQAEALVLTMDQDDPGQADDSHDLDLVMIAELQGATGELEAMAMKSILDANGISAFIVGASTLPNLSFQVGVPREDVARAEAALSEAQAAGPAAAAEAERESEGQT